MITNAAVYQRVSDGTDRSVEQQNAANEDVARGFGWRTTSYSDAVSASRFTDKARPGWAALVADVAAGRSSYVVLWEPSRGDRKLATWAAFLDTCRETGTGIYITSHRRLYDLRNGRDWRSLADDGVDSAFETEKTSDRTRRGVAGAVADQLPTGRIPFGYRRYYTAEPSRKRPLQHQEPHPDEAPLVAEIITRIAQSEAISAIVKDLAARNVTTRAGGAWSRSSVVRLVTDGVVYIGKRRHNGSPLQPGNWPPIVEPDTYWRAVAVLGDPARRPRGSGIRPGGAKWLLSYVARCGVCGGPLTMRHVPRSAGQTAIYRCVNGCVSAPVAWLDRLATAAVVSWCASPLAYAIITSEDDREAAAARDEAAAERARLADFEDQAADGTISAASFARIAAKIEENIARLDARAQALSAPPAVRDLIGASGPAADRERDIYDRWLGMPVSAQRRVVSALFAPVLRPVGSGDPIDPYRLSLNARYLEK